MNELKNEVDEKIRIAGHHVIVMPAHNDSAPIDSFDVFDYSTDQFLVTDAPEKPTREFAVIWNGLLDEGEPTEKIRKINIEWLVGLPEKKAYQ